MILTLWHRMLYIGHVQCDAQNAECHVCVCVCSRTHLFSILLTVYLDAILVNDQLDALFSMYLFHASACFEQQVLIIRRIKLRQYIIWYNTL